MAGTIEPADGYVLNVRPDTGDQSLTVMPDIDTKMHKVAGINAPITFILKKFRTMEATQMAFSYFERKQLPRFDYVATANVAAGTSVVVGHGEYFTRNCKCINERTGEQFVVRSISSDTLTVVRGYGTTEAANMNVGDVIRILQHMASEGQKMADINHVKPEQISNYCQINRTSIGITHIADIQKLWVGDEYKDAMQAALEIHAVKQEEDFLYSQYKKGSYDQSSATLIGGFGSDTAAADWSTRGIKEHMLSYATSDRFVSINGTLTLRDWLDKIIEPFMRRGSEQKVLFVPPVVGQAMDFWKYGKTQMVTKDKEFNLNATVWEIFGGRRVMLIPHNGLAAPSVTSGVPTKGSVCIGFDMAPQYSPVFKQLEKSHVRQITLADGTDAKAAEIYGIAGLQMHDCNNHIWVEGITDYA
jgi:hypothetical protein